MERAFFIQKFRLGIVVYLAFKKSRFPEKMTFREISGFLGNLCFSCFLFSTEIGICVPVSNRVRTTVFGRCN